MNRTWVYQRMIGDTSITDVVGNRIYQDTRMREDEATRVYQPPFIVYRSWGVRPEMRGDDTQLVKREVFQAFVHDTPGDYLKIDALCDNLFILFSDIEDQANDIVRAEWLEMSEDFRDIDMHTIMRYVRFQVKYRDG